MMDERNLASSIRKKSKSPFDNEEESPDIDNGNLESLPECAVCLQTCIHPVKLPCRHIFCFLCVKGAANQSKRCALCRTEIPVDFFNKPNLIHHDDLLKDMSFEDGYQWFYEGRGGWWQYDERTSTELETTYKQGLEQFELLIAGFLYVIDVQSMIQFRRNDPTRRRRIKRDLANIPKKGVAGLRLDSPVREGAYGKDSEASPVVVKIGTETDSIASNSSDAALEQLASQVTQLSLATGHQQRPHHRRQVLEGRSGSEDLSTARSRLQRRPHTANSQQQALTQTCSSSSSDTE